MPARVVMPEPAGRNLTGAEALVRVTEFRALFGDVDEDEL
jgi:hypothetical protein